MCNTSNIGVSGIIFTIWDHVLEDYIYMRKMLRLRKKNLLNLQILKMVNLNMTDVLYFPIFMCIVFHYTILKTVKLPLYLTHNSPSASIFSPASSV